MQNKFSKKLAMIIVTILAISTVSAVIPFGFSTITNRPTVYDSTGVTTAPIQIEAGTTASIDTTGMTITGAQIWLWLSTTGGSEINTALGDRPYAGPFLLSQVVDTVSPHTYTFTPTDLADLCTLLAVDSPFAGEQRTYTFTVGNNWINGSIPLKVQGDDVDYWIKIADVSTADTIAGSEIGVSTNRVHFLPGFYATPLMSAPETAVTVSGYALPATSEYNITEDGVTALGLLVPDSHDEGGWLWTGFSTAFNIMDLENKVPFGTAPSVFTPVNITVWENDTATDLATWDFDQYWREVYLEDEASPLTFRGDTGDYSGIVTLNTGGTYDTDILYFPAYGTASIYLGEQLVASGMALNGTGGALIPITVPALTTGDYTFCVKDNNAVMYNFTVHVVMVPYIYCTPDSGYVGDSFAVTGVNFLDYIGQYVTIYFENSAAYPYYTLMLNFTVPSSTWTTAALTVPQSWGGPRYVEARITDGTTIIAYDIYTVLSMIDVIPDVVNQSVCQVVQVVGTGFSIGGEGSPEDYFFYIDNEMYFGDDEDWGWAINATGYILTEFAAAGFRPGLHVVHVIADYEGAMPWIVFAKDNFIVSTEGDLIKMNIDGYLEYINVTVVSISDGMATLLTTMGELDATIVALDGTIATLSTAVGEIQVDLTALDAKVTSIQGTVATISTKVGTIQTTVSGLDSKITSVSNGMATVQTSLGTIETSLSSLDVVVGSMYGDVLIIQTAIGTFETSLDALDASITVMGDDITAIAGDIVSIETSIGTIEGTITDIEGSIATVETDLGTVKVDLADAKTDISAVEADVDESLPVDMMPVWLAVIFALIAAIGSIAGVFIIQRKIAG